MTGFVLPSPHLSFRPVTHSTDDTEPPSLLTTRANALQGISLFGSLVVTHDGPVYRLERVPKITPKPIPSTLSATGLFSDPATLQTAPGVHPYEINAAAWADGAAVFRHFAVPPGRRHLCPGWGKSAEELAIAQRVRSGPHAAMADLVPETGETQPCQVGDQTLSHRFPSRAECAACHTQRSFFALAFSTEQLQRGSQLDALVVLGLFRNGQEPRPLPRSPRTQRTRPPHGHPRSQPDASDRQ